MSTDDVVVREATIDDLSAIIALHAADEIGGHGDLVHETLMPDYRRAFAALSDGPAHGVFVAVQAGEVVGTFIVTIKPGLTGRAQTRAELRSVQVRVDRRSSGIGERMVTFAQAEARRRGATVMELTSNNQRHRAHQFYERLGFSQSHLGFKIKL